MATPVTMHAAVEDYLAFRRKLGFALRIEGEEPAYDLVSHYTSGSPTIVPCQPPIYCPADPPGG